MHWTKLLFLFSIVARLSDPAAEIDEDKFKEIMKYIIGLIDKDKHSESLVSKIVMILCG